MIAERGFAWTLAVLSVLLLWAGLTNPTPSPSDRVVAIGLGAVVALPLALVYLGWLSSLGNWQRGWR